ncbi:MAG: hypothetical protein HQL33_01960 [Alphaproteobacteria bacterium]|nr:hypothetical protein [Alphaproteobacteria bacterium]
MSSILRMSVVLGLASAVASFSLDPFVDEKFTGTLRLARTSVNQQDFLEVCYNASFTTPQTVTAVAREECARRGRGRDVVLTGQTYWQCRFLLPTRAYFQCVGPPVTEGDGTPAPESDAASPATR